MKSHELSDANKMGLVRLAVAGETHNSNTAPQHLWPSIKAVGRVLEQGGTFIDYDEIVEIVRKCPDLELITELNVGGVAFGISRPVDYRVRCADAPAR